jgi:alkylation response protein AidB-like acyl-CoA dehydrogenase
MVNHTRLDCVIGSSAWTRQAVAQALHHCAHRSAFGRRLVEQPLMQNVLADLAVESEAATVMMRLARAYDEGPHDDRQNLFKRLATAVVKLQALPRRGQRSARVPRRQRLRRRIDSAPGSIARRRYRRSGRARAT